MVAANYQVLYPTYLFRCIQTINTLALIGAEKSVTEVLMKEKEKWTNIGNGIKQELADSLIHNTTCRTQVCIKFQTPRLCTSCEIFDENFPIHYI